MPELTLSPLYETLFNTILLKHGELSGFIAGLFAFLFVIGIVLRFVDMIQSDDDSKEFPWRSTFFGFVFIVFLYFFIMTPLFKTIVGLNDALANMIVSQDKVMKFYQIAIEGKLIEYNEAQDKLLGVFRMKLSDILSYIIIYLADIAFYILKVWRMVLLGVLFMFAPFVFALAILPMYGKQHISKFFIDVIQISFWVVLKAGFDFIFFIMFTSNHYSSIYNIVMDGMWPHLVLIIAYIVGIFCIPSIAAKVVGGNNYNSPLAATAILLTQLPKIAKGFGALSNLMPSILGKMGGPSSGGIDDSKSLGEGK